MKKFVSWLLVFAMVLGFGEVFAVPAAAATVITQLDVSGVTPAVVGQMPVTEGIVCNVPGVTVTVSWNVFDYQSGAYYAFSDAFAEGKVYRLRLILEAQEGYEFDYDSVKNYTVNGQAADYAMHYWSTRVELEMFYLPEDVQLVDRVAVQALPELKLGQTVNAEVIKNAVVLPEDAPYWISDVDFYDADGQTVDGPAEKKVYRCDFDLSPKEGYWLDAANLSVDLPEGCEYSVSSRSLEVRWYPDLRDVVSQVELTLPAYQPGDALELQGITVSGGTLNPEESEWTDGSYNPVTGVMEDGKQYFLWCVIDPAEGCRFDEENTVVTVSGDPDPSIYIYADSITVDCEVDFRKEQLGYIDVTDLPEEIKPGAAPTVAPQVEYDEAEVTGVRWTDVSGQTVTEFVDGKVYYLELTMKPAKGYAFQEDLDVYCDAWVVSVSAQADTATVLLRYSLLPKVKEVALTVTGLQKGAPIADVQVTVPESAGYTVAGLRIFDMGTMEYVTEGTFADKSNYELIYVLEPAEGWEFADWPQVSVNEEPTIQYWVDQGQLQIYGVFTTCDPIDKVAVTVSEPQVGGNVADAVATVPADVPYTVECTWYDLTAEEYVEDGVFQDAHKYQLELDIRAAVGYCFTEDTQLTVNGEVQSESDASFYGDSGACWMEYSFLEPIETVAFPAFPTDIKVGDTVVPEAAAPAGAKYTLQASWTDVQTDEAGPVLAGHCYGLTYLAMAAPGCEFTDDTVFTVGGQVYDQVLRLGESAVVVMKTYNFGMEEIRQVELTVEEPEIGERVSEFQVAGEAPGYALVNSQWAANKTGNVDDDVNYPMVFLEGYYHYAVVTLSAEEGTVFADDVEVFVNGKKMEVLDSMHLGTAVYLLVGFGKLIDAEPGDLDADGDVDEDDAIYLLRHVLMPSQFAVEQEVDFNGDGQVNEDDAIRLLRHVLMPELFPLK